VKIDSPDERGVGEVIASGPNVMLGYYENPEATAQVVQSGWLHTGDLGKIDEKGRLTIVGRKKEMILGSNGENVYPDELEDLYRDSPYVEEISIVGLPEDSGTGETVATLVRPAVKEGMSKEEVRERVLEHVKDVSAKLPLYKRVKVVHLTDLELPKTATRKVKRKDIVVELQKLERLKKKAAQPGAGGDDKSWIHEILSTVSNKPRERVYSGARLQELGFDSLMYTELGVALEAAGVAVPENADLTGIDTVEDFEKLVAQWGRRKKTAPVKKAKTSMEADEIHVPKPIAQIGSAILTWAQKRTYTTLFETKVTGTAYVPKSTGFLVAANHASHLDMGLVKHAIGDWGPHLVALAAKDYFFNDPIKRAYFENFTNLVPMDRHGSLRESLRTASEVIRQGYILLIFPEGTRSPTGRMVDFKPSLGYLALSNQVDVLPMYLQGTHDALPKGAALPKNRNIAAHIGPLVTWQELKRATEGMARGDAYREASRLVELRVRALAPKDHPDHAGVAPRSRGRLGAESVIIQDPQSLVSVALSREEEPQ
jgi:long-chain acyl-CoA synthetase